MAPIGTRATDPQTWWSDLLRSTCATLDLAVVDVPDDLALAKCIREGLPANVIEGLIRHGLPEADVFRSVIPRRTWQRRRQAEERLTPDESDRAERFARIFALAEAVFEDAQQAVAWLTSPKQRFEGQRPLDLLSSGIGTKIVEETLLQAYYGNVA